MTTTSIPLNKLRAWEGNVRKTESDKGIDELAASIAAHGLLQSLVARKDKRGKFAVIAGRRRLLALNSLAAKGAIETDRPIPCHVIEADADATEVSLAENVQREAMHPADECDAFLALSEGGMPLPDIAARFGVTEAVVQKRLRIARVSPSLLAIYRQGGMTLQHVMALAASDDHAAQERVWNGLREWQKDDPDVIRDQLTEHEVTATDRRVTFVTLEAYEAAGGTVRRDLFCDDENGTFIDDIALLDRLVAEKLESAAALARAEGWKWVEIRPVFDHAEWSDCRRQHPEPVPFTEAEQAEFDALEAEAAALENGDSELDEAQQERLEALEERIAELDDRPRVFDGEVVAIAGVVVSIGDGGEPDLRCGLVRPEHMPKAARKGASGAQEQSADKATALPAALVESLTAHRSAALNAALLERGDVALALLVHALAMPVFYNGPRGDSVLQVSAVDASLHRVEGSPAHQRIEAARDHWLPRSVPATRHCLDRCVDLSRAWLLTLPRDRFSNECAHRVSFGASVGNQ